MPILNFWEGFEYTDLDGSAMGAGSLDQAGVINSLTQKYENVVTLAQNAIGTLWDYQHGLTDFTFCRIETDVGTAALPVMLELTTDLAAAVQVGYSTVALRSGFPYVLFSSKSYANYTANFAGGTMETIQRFRVKNLNATSANVRIWLAK